MENSKYKTHKHMSGEELLKKAMTPKEEPESEDEDEDEEDEVELKKSELRAEHERLVSILESGDPKLLKEEARRQRAELKEYL